MATRLETFFSHNPMRRRLRVSGWLLACALPLAGCFSYSAEGEKKFTETLLFAGTTPLPPQKEDVETREYGCPQLALLDGAEVYRVGQNAGPRGVTYQAYLQEFARECKVEGTQMRIKIGVQGRLVLGDNGKAGTYTLPLRLAARADGSVKISRPLNVSVAVQDDKGQNAFTFIDEGLVLPITARDPGDEYTLYLGFDTAAKTGPRPKRR